MCVCVYAALRVCVCLVRVGAFLNAKGELQTRIRTASQHLDANLVRCVVCTHYIVSTTMHIRVYVLLDSREYLQFAEIQRQSQCISSIFYIVCAAGYGVYGCIVCIWNNKKLFVGYYYYDFLGEIMTFRVLVCVLFFSSSLFYYYFVVDIAHSGDNELNERTINGKLLRTMCAIGTCLAVNVIISCRLSVSFSQFPFSFGWISLYALVRTP